jgi:hypothetical protein
MTYHLGWINPCERDADTNAIAVPRRKYARYSAMLEAK